MDAKLSREESKEWLRRAVALNPRYLVNALSESDDDKSYEDFFDQWLKTSPDPVKLSNVAHRMISIYDRTGRKDKATRLADMAAKTYSQLGLCAKADLLESRGQIDPALDGYAGSANAMIRRGRC